MDTINIPLMVSFSGGRTSAFMTLFLKNLGQYKEQHVLFANTGKEKQETLDFVNECDKRWNLNVIWLEADVQATAGVGTTFKRVTYQTASRNGEPFSAMIEKYGLPNKSFPHCTRELKQRPLTKFMQSLGHKYWHTAIGIRTDEAHRIKAASGSKQFDYIYPLATSIKADASFIRNWWDKQPFDLQLKDYEGNCDFCWKKSLRKRLTLLAENPKIADQWHEWEIADKYTFDRDGYSIAELQEMAQQPFEKVRDSHELSLEKPAPVFSAQLDIEYDCFCKST